MNSSTTYGELLPIGIDKFLKHIDPLGDDDMFLDVGSGYGKLVARVADVTKVGRSVGVEIVKDRYDVAIKKYGSNPRTEFHCGDVLDTDYLEQADVLIMNSLTWPRKITKTIMKRIKSGGLVLCNSSHLIKPSVENDEFIKFIKLPTSWYKQSRWYLFKKK